MKLALYCLIAIGVCAGPVSLWAQPGFDHTHRHWTKLLTKYVHLGSVDYAKWHRLDRPALERYLKQLSIVDAKHYGAFTKAQRLAYWINVYNAFMVNEILDHYPLSSVRDIGIMPYAAFTRDIVPITITGESSLDLHDVENEILRAKFNDPRIHFAIVCASLSCPSLRSTAFDADHLEAQLQEQTVMFFADNSKNRYDPKSKTLHLSKIFEWYRGDFEKEGKGLVAYVRRYWSGTVLPEQPKVSFLTYDWSLNGH